MTKGKISKKKIILIVVALICIVAIAAGIGAKRHKAFMTPVQYQVKSISFTSFAYNKDLKLIAHRGYRAIAPENTLPAFSSAGTAGYWGAECDVQRTSDGVWVLMHDKDVDRMTDGKGKVENLTYEELKGFTVDNGNGIEDYSDTKIPTLDEYLAECANYNMKAVIELKSENNTEHYGEIVNAVKEHKTDAVYISFFENDLKEMRKLDGNAQMFLLVKKIDSKAIETAKSIGNCGIDFSADEKANYKNDGEAIKKITEEGLTAAAWTVDELDKMEKLIGYGVLIQTTDCITY